MGLTSLNTLLTDITIKQGGRSRFDLGADLNFRQIEIVEEERKGGDVQFRLVLRILSSWVNGRPQRQITRFSHSPVTVRMARWAENLRIPESEWLKMLDQMGYERLRLIELPIPEPPIGTVIDSSLRHIEEARKCFNEGDYDDVLVNCRKTIEEIEHAKIDLVSLLESDSKAEKIETIVKKVKEYLHLGPHIGVRIDRKDAEAALYFTIDRCLSPTSNSRSLFSPS